MFCWKIDFKYYRCIIYKVDQNIIIAVPILFDSELNEETFAKVLWFQVIDIVNKAYSRVKQITVFHAADSLQHQGKHILVVYNYVVIVHQSWVRIRCFYNLDQEGELENDLPCTEYVTVTWMAANVRIVGALEVYALLLEIYRITSNKLIYLFDTKCLVLSFPFL